MSYRYRAVAFRDGRKSRDEVVELSGVELYHAATSAGLSQATGRPALLELVNKWNRTGLIGADNLGPVYVYSAEN